MSMAVGSKLQFEPGSWLEAAYDVCIGCIVGARHSTWIVWRWWKVHALQPTAGALFGAEWASDNDVVQSKDGVETLKVVAVGYGRTGTYSLTLALEELGMPTLHTQHLYEHQEIINMWTNDIFLPSIEAKEPLMGKPDLQLIARKGYQATADLPMALYFDQVMEQYPDCKFILTTRESSEIWFNSWSTLTRSISQPTYWGGLFFKNVRQYTYYLRWLFSVVNKDPSYLTLPFPLPDQQKERAIASYEEHNRRVRAEIPSDKLLEYNVRQGWEPLCEFLEIDDCPTTPFPKTNSARSVKVQAVSAFLVPLCIVLFILCICFSKTFKRMTGMTVMQWAQYKSRELMLTLRKTLIGQEQAPQCWEAPMGKKRLSKKA